MTETSKNRSCNFPLSYGGVFAYTFFWIASGVNTLAMTGEQLLWRKHSRNDGYTGGAIVILNAVKNPMGITLYR